MSQKCIMGTEIGFVLLLIFGVSVLVLIFTFVLWKDVWLVFRLLLVSIGLYLALVSFCKRLKDAEDS